MASSQENRSRLRRFWAMAQSRWFRSLRFRREEDRLRLARIISRTILGVAVVLMACVLGLVYSGLQRDEIFPEKSERYDVDTLYVAPMANACPAGAESLAAADFETCLQELTLEPGEIADSFRAVEIPAFDEVADEPAPGFKSLLKEQNYPELFELFEGKGAFVIGMEIPAKYFSQDRLAEDPNGLVFYGMQDGRLCFDGRCPHVITRYEQNAVAFPLVTRETSDQRAMNEVWIFGKDPEYPLGPLLIDGIFATSMSNIYRLDKLYPIIAHGRSLIVTMIFFGLFLLSFGFAYVWGEFPDYAAFCYLSCSFALNVLINSGIGASLVGTDWIYGAYGWTALNLVIAATTFAFAAARVDARIILRFVLGAHLGAGTILPLLLVNTPNVKVFFQIVDYVMAFSMLLVPTGIAFWGGWSCYRLKRGLGDAAPLSAKLDFRRRAIEQLICGVLLFVVGSEFLLDFLVRSSSKMQILSVPFSILGLFLVFIVILYHSTAKLAKTHFRKDAKSEALRLRERLSTEKYQDWLSQERSGIVLQVDLQNSSGAANSLKAEIHKLMQQLRDAIAKTHETYGFHWIMLKKNGDEWIFVLSQKSESLRQDVADVVRSTVADAPKWNSLVQSMASDSSLHINIYAIRSYTLFSGYRRKADYKAEGAADEEIQTTGVQGVETIDFASEEANYLMKWCGKAEEPRSIVVGGGKDMLGELLATGRSVEKISKIIADSSSANKETYFQAEQLGLYKVVVPWRASAEGFADDPNNGKADKHPGQAS